MSPFTRGQCFHDLISRKESRFTKKSGKRVLGHIANSITPTTYQPAYNIFCNKVISWKGVSVEKRKRTKKEEVSNDIENYFFHLASECYDEGFLAHIEYLKSIAVAHNSIKKTSNKRNTQHSDAVSQRKLSSPRSSSVESSVSSNNSFEEDLSKSAVAGRFAAIVKRLLKNRQLKTLSSKNDQQDLKICVNITRSTSLDSLNSYSLNRYNSGPKPFEYNSGKRCIMSDFLNATGPREIVDANIDSTVKRQHFHDLIENLNKLEINDSGVLPKITISLADDNLKSTVCSSSQHNSRSIQKQDSLEVSMPFLNDYSSEARPPL